MNKNSICSLCVFTNLSCKNCPYYEGDDDETEWQNKF